jgi:transposase
MGKRFKDYQPNQLLLFPPSPLDWLPCDHPVHFINEVVEELDLSAIINDYQEKRGQPPYHPVMMVKILVYGYWRGIRSSRRLERALYEDVGFRYLSANQQPDFWTIAAFRRRHHKALGELFVQTVRLAKKAGLLTLEHVAVDGTKIKANASKHSAMSYGYMEKEEERLRQEVEQYLKEAEELDRLEDERSGPQSRGYELPEHLRHPAKRLEAIRKAKAELEAEAGRKAEEKHKPEVEKEKRTPKRAEQPKPSPRTQYNFTDPDSRIMLSSDKSFIQAYNAQAAVDAQSQIIVAADLTNQAADAPHLLPLVEQVEENLSQRPREVSADAGYFSEANIMELGHVGVEAFIPPDKVKHSQWRTAEAPKGRIPKNATVRKRMRRKLKTKRGRARYKLRQTTVEPVFGQIKQGRGLGQFLLRGLEKVRSSWRFDCAVHNLIKLFRAGVWVRPEGVRA